MQATAPHCEGLDSRNRLWFRDGLNHAFRQNFSCDVPQDSILGPFLVSLYALPLGIIAWSITLAMWQHPAFKLNEHNCEKNMKNNKCIIFNLTKTSKKMLWCPNWMSHQLPVTSLTWYSHSMLVGHFLNFLAHKVNWRTRTVGKLNKHVWL